MFFGGVGYLAQMDGAPTVQLLANTKQKGVLVALQVPPVIRHEDIHELVIPCLQYVDYIFMTLATARVVTKMEVRFYMPACNTIGDLCHVRTRVSI